MIRPYAHITATIIALGLATAANAALVNLTPIESITQTSGQLESITVGGITYNGLRLPNSVEDTETLDDYVHIAATPPADLDEAIRSFDLTVGTLNFDYKAQFASFNDDTLIYVLVNSNDNTPDDGANVFAIDAGGNRLNVSSVLIDFNDTAVPVLFGSQSYNRTQNGVDQPNITRILAGAVFTLSDLGLDGLGATGIEIVTASFDTQVIGTVIPTPAALPAGLGLMLAVAARRRRDRTNR